MSIVSIDYAPRASFAVAAAEAGPGYLDPSLLREGPKPDQLAASNELVGSSSLDPNPGSYLLNQDEHMRHCLAAWGTAMMRLRLRSSPIRVVDFGGATGGH